jgi:hypothetical protein
MIIFLALTILSVPLMLIFNKYDGMNQTLTNNYGTDLSLGNFGFSAPSCRFFYVNMDKNISFSCRTGIIGQLYSYGIVSSKFNDTSLYEFCGTE